KDDRRDGAARRPNDRAPRSRFGPRVDLAEIPDGLAPPIRMTGEGPLARPTQSRRYERSRARERAAPLEATVTLTIRCRQPADRRSGVIAEQWPSGVASLTTRRSNRVPRGLRTTRRSKFRRLLSRSSTAAATRDAYTPLTRVVHARCTYRLFLLVLVLPFVGAAGVGRASEFHVDIVAVDLSGRQMNLTQGGGSFNASPAVARGGRIEVQGAH